MNKGEFHFEPIISLFTFLASANQNIQVCNFSEKSIKSSKQYSLNSKSSKSSEINAGFIIWWNNFCASVLALASQYLHSLFCDIVSRQKKKRFIKIFEVWRSTHRVSQSGLIFTFATFILGLSS